MASQQTTLSYNYPPGVSLGPQASPVRQHGPGLPVNLGSNNPFRTRTLSPSSSTHSGGRPERPKSTNPFLDDTDPISPQSAPSASLIDQQDMTQNTRDLFENLSLNPAPKASGMRPAPAPPRPEKPSQNGPLKSRPPRSSKERSEGRSNDPFNIFSDPPSKAKPSGSGSRSRDRERRPRRNSESSVMERTPKLLDDEDERRRRERRRREREARHKDGKSRSSRKPGYQLDIIDKLDVTSIYGTGMFHHDGPFDACNPHRNRKGLRAAPLQAFPKDSSNMALGGAGPNNQNIDLNLFHGRTEEGYNDFASTGVVDNRKTEGVAFDPTSRIEPVHGAESMGLGTSTFLDGTPASRAAVKEAETEQTGLGAGGLARKKSLAQRIRGGINRPAPRVSPHAGYRSPGSASGNMTSPRNEKNPFFQDYDDAWDQKAARINSAEESRAIPEVGRERSSSSPKQATAASLERRQTGERTNSGLEEGKNASGGGFINRMKSLRKPQPRRRATDD
ncbi:Pal1 cell morphology protein-domain-containing protein [Aspergillus keveii]|uniref:Pal1 cell morphology protein-domain-containing protein n=1 Tax=Aspergillus keveii TaxID=714993 RepID=A0ABR4G644_9EURO